MKEKLSVKIDGCFVCVKLVSPGLFVCFTHIRNKGNEYFSTIFDLSITKRELFSPFYLSTIVYVCELLHAFIYLFFNKAVNQYFIRLVSNLYFKSSS